MNKHALKHTPSPELRQRAQAIHAADRALAHLRRAADLLDSAKSWGYFDMFLGGIVSSMIKHRRIDDAEDEFNAARAAVQRFARTMNDFDPDEIVRFDRGGFVAGIDIFLDNVFADIFVQRKIEKAQVRVGEAIEHISLMRERLMDV
ncbi:hypothetical protein K6V98_03890 [Collinsella sp. AGMB00827]|uniref:Uncharacterized protein n=1 Tax=Collinsella ureilytica TaxID=2869515 RepID=A0ABS7MKD4_9ACTN|nr:hypothetical protein [Collinsella urealyticum]MBY4797498.1 hypothetical protein [Collinsella urealyticum]